MSAVLSGLDTDTEESEGDRGRRSVSHSSQASGQFLRSRNSETDFAHLTMATVDGAPFMTSTHARSRRSFNSTGDAPPQDQPPNWSSFLNGAKKFLDTLIDLGEGSEEDDFSEAYNNESLKNNRLKKTKSSQSIPGMMPNESIVALLEEEALQLATTPPKPLEAPPLSEIAPELYDVSNLIDQDSIRAIASEVPLRHRQAKWKLAYSSQRDGISLQTLLRKCKGRAPTVLLVRDLGKAVFGAYCSESWKLSPRYFGTGETFVFTIAPKSRVWHWWWKKMNVQQNDFFMWASSGGIAVGGAGGYALWLDSDLLNGISRISATFGNECLASEEEFQIGAVECWWLD